MTNAEYDDGRMTLLRALTFLCLVHHPCLSEASDVNRPQTIFLLSSIGYCNMAAQSQGHLDVSLDEDKYAVHLQTLPWSHLIFALFRDVDS